MGSLRAISGIQATEDQLSHSHSCFWVISARIVSLRRERAAYRSMHYLRDYLLQPSN